VPGAPADSGDNPSPLEVALGIKPSGQAKIKTPAQIHPEADAPPASSDDAGSGQAAPQPDPAALSGAAQGWWNMLQKQFDTLAAATVAGMQAGQPDPGSGAKPRKTAAKRSRAASAAAKPTAGTGPAKTKAASSPRKRSVGTRRKA